MDEGTNKNIIGYRFTSKELDTETGLYYFGARYLDPRTSRWISPDPVIADYLPEAPVSDEAKQRNQNLPGQGGVFTPVNLSLYHYTANNPIKYVDPDGSDTAILILDEAQSFVRSAGPQLSGVAAKLGVIGTALAAGAFAMEKIYPSVIEAIKTDIEVFKEGTESILNLAKAEGEEGAKSEKELEKHIKKLEEAKGKVQELEEKLGETKGPRRQRPIRKAIQKLGEQIRGHEKEIRQKWPDHDLE